MYPFPATLLSYEWLPRFGKGAPPGKSLSLSLTIDLAMLQKSCHPIFKQYAASRVCPGIDICRTPHFINSVPSHVGR